MPSSFFPDAGTPVDSASSRQEYAARVLRPFLHDLNNALMPVLTDAGFLIAMPSLPPDAQQSLQAMEEGGQAACTMVQTLMAWFPKDGEDPAPVDLGQMLRRLHTRWGGQQVQITPPAHPLLSAVPPLPLEIALEALVLHASRQGLVEVTATPKEGLGIVSLRANGNTHWPLDEPHPIVQWLRESHATVLGTHREGGQAVARVGIPLWDGGL